MLEAVDTPYFRDLQEQPAALSRTLANLKRREVLTVVTRFLTQRFRRVVLTGMGSSFHALHVPFLMLCARGQSAVMIETSELVHHAQGLLDETTLVIAVSQSGSSAETVRLLDLDSPARVLGITNDPRGALARRSDHAVMIEAGPEASVSCKTYVSTLLALQWLAAAMTAADVAALLDELSTAPELVAQCLSRWPEAAQNLARELRAGDGYELVGRGASLSAVGTGALIIKEAARVPAEGLSSAAFRHGPIEMLSRDIVTLVFTGDPPTQELNRRLLLEIKAREQRVYAIERSGKSDPFALPDCHRAVLPILEIVPIQLLTLVAAQLSGHQAGRFDIISKITATE